MASQTDFKAKLKLKKAEVDSALSAYFEDSDVSKYSRYGQEAWAHLEEFSKRPGKRIRGSLVLTAYEMFGGQNRDQALKAAVAIELIQNYLLIVDDVMDRSEIRRGKPAIHEEYYKRLRKLPGEDEQHLGDMLAINVGLVIAHAASQLMTEIELDPKVVLKANTVFHKNVMTTGFGQIDDLYSGKEQTSEEDVLLTHEFKSSYYTFINPMQVGAILAGANDAECEEIARFGTAAGIAFQLQDDIIGLFGEPDETGKSYLDDLKEGKHTLIIQQAFEKTDKSGAIIISNALGNHNVTEEQANEVREVIAACGAKTYADKVARDYVEASKKVISASSWPEEHAEFLDQLMDYIVERIA